jgi:4-hydroxy-3-methylbut-2-enyl diphosphate reductase
MTAPPLRIVLAQPRGFCAGVERAIGIVERALERFGPPVYVRHEIVHNKHVVDALKTKGARFVDEVDQIPRGAVAVFSAHGVAETVELAARERGLHVIDAACPLVTKVHKEGQRYAGNGFDVVLIGHAGHPEVEGTMGRIRGRVHLIGSVEDVARLEPSDPSRLAFVTQTTLSVDDTRDIIVALRARFPAIVGPDTRDICYATQNRQTAVRALARQVDLILVVGARNSSNSNRLRELGEAAGTPSYLIESAEALELRWLNGVRTLGITAGASAPELLVQDLIGKLRARYAVEVEVLAGIEENVHFRLPPELADRGVPAVADRPAIQ